MLSVLAIRLVEESYATYLVVVKGASWASIATPLPASRYSCYIRQHNKWHQNAWVTNKLNRQWKIQSSKIHSLRNRDQNQRVMSQMMIDL